VPRVKQAKSRKPRKRGGKPRSRAALHVMRGVLEDLLLTHPIWEDIVALMSPPPPVGMGIPEGTLREWARGIRQRWEADARQALPQLRAEDRARVTAVYARSMKRDTVKADQVALNAAKVIAQIDGVLAPAQITVNNNTNVLALTPSQRQQEIAQLLAKRERALAESRARARALGASSSVIDVAAVER
jgi:hypothetical protein